jgi:hypothetical protein
MFPDCAAARLASGFHRVLTVCICALATTIAVGIQSSAGAPRFDVCETEIREYVRRELGQTVTKVEFYYYYGDSSHFGGEQETTQAIVYTKECPGYHFFDVYANYATCTQTAHYGKARQYADFRSSNDGC